LSIFPPNYKVASGYEIASSKVTGKQTSIQLKINLEKRILADLKARDLVKLASKKSLENE